LSGIPCSHAICAMYFRTEQPEEYVHDCYKLETYHKMYKPIIQPMNGSNMWPRSAYTPVLPPIVHELPGRKKTKRKKGAHEKEGVNEVGTSKDKGKVKLGKKNQNTLRCSNCGTLGHNKRSCKKSGQKRAREPVKPVSAFTFVYNSCLMHFLTALI